MKPAFLFRKYHYKFKGGISMKTKYLVFLGILLLFSITFANKDDGQGRRAPKVPTDISKIIFELN